MSDVTIDVKGMTCDHCAGAVSGAVTEVNGVTDVDVDVAGGKVTVVGEGVDQAAVRAAIIDAGYEAVG